MNLDVFKQFAGKETNEKVRGNSVVIYTRVSTKEQAEGNASLTTQKKYCEDFAKKRNLQILEYFGGTYESAKSDERKEFKKMLEFVKRKKDVAFIIVYSYDRFSRTGANGAYISDNLQKQGVAVLSVTQELNPATPSGSFQQNLYYIFSQFDNEQRKDKTITGMKEKLRQGYWVWNPPFGYKNMNPKTTADKHKLVINEQGRFLKKAFEWKANYDWSVLKIEDELRELGCRITHKKLYEHFRNPFYCGIITTPFLPGEVIDGKHTKLVSREVFLKVNNLMPNNRTGRQIDNDYSNLPLKQFVRCDECGTIFTGYIVRKKGLYYYKCNQKGCKKNRNAVVMHSKFKELLGAYTINEKYIDVMEEAIYYTFNDMFKDQAEIREMQESKLYALNNKKEKLDERFAYGEISKEMYQKFSQKLIDEEQEIIKKQESMGIGSSNLEKCVENAMQISTNLNNVWELGECEEKRKIQYLLFPEGVMYNYQNHHYRTFSVNSAFAPIPYVKQILGETKTGKIANFSNFSRVVASTGIEPVSMV